MSFEVNGLSQGHGKPGFNVHSGLALTCEGNNDLLIVSRSSFTLLVIIFRLLLLFNGLQQYVWGKFTKKTWLISLPILQFQLACAIFFRRIIKKCCVFIILLLCYENESLFPEHFFSFCHRFHGMVIHGSSVVLYEPYSVQSPKGGLSIGVKSNMSSSLNSC